MWRLELLFKYYDRKVIEIVFNQGISRRGIRKEDKKLGSNSRYPIQVVILAQHNFHNVYIAFGNFKMPNYQTPNECYLPFAMLIIYSPLKHHPSQPVSEPLHQGLLSQP